LILIICATFSALALIIAISVEVAKGVRNIDGANARLTSKYGFKRKCNEEEREEVEE